jgi:hypothetical protein
MEFNIGCDGANMDGHFGVKHLNAEGKDISYGETLNNGFGCTKFLILLATYNRINDRCIRES